MALSDFIGCGTTLSANYYVRNFYIANRDARTNSKRQSMNNTELSLADGLALRRAVKELRSSDFSDSQDTNIRNRVLAYIETYNNALSSTSDSSDHALTRSGKQLQSITKEYADSLDKIGITIKEDGSLASRDSLFKTASLSKFEKLFSGDSDYMQRTLACAKKIERRSDELNLSEKSKLLQSSTGNKPDSTPDSSGDSSTIAASLTLSGEGIAVGSGNTAAAQIVAASLGLTAPAENAPGNHVNIVL